jgi:uncharacterized membrane protein
MANSSDEQRRARGLALFGLGLGTAQLVAPRGLNWIAGVHDRVHTRALQRVVGVREIAAGIAILGAPQPYPFVWSRVAGDAMDLAMLGLAFASPRNKRGCLALTTLTIGGITAMDVLASLGCARRNGRLAPDGAMRVRASVTVNRDPDDVYRYWRNFENLPSFLAHVESVTVLDDTRSHWVANAPGQSLVEWDAEIVADVPGTVLSWGSVVGSGIENSGRVEFVRAPRDQGTEVHVVIEYKPPAGALGAAVAKLFGEEPSQQIKDDLRRFKQVVETGEVMRSDATPAGITAARQLPFRQREAQPLAGGMR